MIRMILIFCFLLISTLSYAQNTWSGRDELYAACGQDPEEWCIQKLVQKCGRSINERSIICARKNANTISKLFASHSKCANKVCDSVRSSGGGTPEAIECYRKADILCK